MEKSVFDFINDICPEHSRTSCSDDNIENAPSGELRGRCERCSLLFLAEKGTKALDPKLLEELRNFGLGSVL